MADEEGITALSTGALDGQVEADDADVLASLDPAVADWWQEAFGHAVAENGGFFTPPQKEAIPLVRDGENVLVCAPTGSGKTLASFTAVIDDLVERVRADALDNEVYCVYVSPLRSLANDIHRNLSVPLDGIRERLTMEGLEVGGGDATGGGNGGDDSDFIHHAIRHGDTDDAARQRMLTETPHILNTTPETLAILLNSPKFREKLRSVEYVIVDEIHSLADGKRGTHLSVSLERLESLADGSPTRIGCSATVEPIETMAEFLVGQCEAERSEASEPANGAERRDPDVTGEPRDSDGETESTSESRDSDGETESTGQSRDCDGNAGSVNVPRDYEVVDARFAREYDLSLSCPVDDLIGTPRHEIRDRFFGELHDLIGRHTNTIVFTNTRSGAESVLHELRERFVSYDETNSACHHGSLAKETRETVEGELKEGSLDVVTTSTSLELGIDMPHVDLVVQVGSPKSVAALLQRVGRAGHSVGETVTGRVIALDHDELIECAVMLERADAGFVDRAFVPEGAHDVAAQHVYGMAINGIRTEREVKRILRRAYPYRNYDDENFETLLRYLTADYQGLARHNVYAKVWRDANDPPEGTHHHPEFDVGERLIGKRGRLARVIYMTNVGTIPDSFSCDVYAGEDEQWVGQLDENYLDTLEPGDVFVLGGDRYEYRYRRGGKVYVNHTSDRPTVPSWYSERLPLSYDLAREIIAFYGDVLDRLGDGGLPAIRHWLRSFPVDERAVRAITSLLADQVAYAGAASVPTDRRIVVEEERDRTEYERRFYVHTCYGRRFNDGLSRLVARRIAARADANVAVAVGDSGFSLSMPLNRKVDVAEILRGLAPGEIREELRASLDGTDLLKRYFRINATRALLILKRYKGYEKSASQQQVSSEMLLGFVEDLEDFAVLEETYRELLEDKLNVDGIEAVAGEIATEDIDVEHVRVDSPSPLSFGLATMADADVVLAEDESAALREFHRRVHEAIGQEPDSGEEDDGTPKGR